MPSKLRKAFDAMKDQTSISLLKVSAGGITSSSSKSMNQLDVAILKATTHEELPIEERYVTEVILLASSSRAHATCCVHALARRLARTHSWVVALKSLTLTLCLLHHAHPLFHSEILSAMRHGNFTLDCCHVDHDGTGSAWDCTAFVRTFALYLDELFHCSLMGKLRHRLWPSSRENLQALAGMKPAHVLDLVVYWQRLLGRALATRPTGPAKNNRLIQISLYSVVHESFDLYHDMSEALSLLQTSFCQLPHPARHEAFEVFNRAALHFDVLSIFYVQCKGIGVGRTSEYPNVQKISLKTLEDLNVLLKKPHNSHSWSPSPVNQVSSKSMAQPLRTKTNQDGETKDHEAVASDKKMEKKEREEIIDRYRGE